MLTEIVLRRVMFTLAWIAYAGDLLPEGPARNADALREAVRNRLATTETVKGQWNLVWGPASSRLPGAVFDDHMVYAVEHAADPKMLVIAIRGTNPISLSTWLFENFHVGTLKSWPWAPPTGLDPAISGGTHMALGAIRRLESVPSGSAEPLTLVELLRRRVAEPGGTNIIITGHSLGGLLASTLALSLVDTRDAWDPGLRASLTTYSFGAPTAGNTDFAEYTSRRLRNPELRSELHRIWNTLDIVPRAWDIHLMEPLLDLYAAAVPMIRFELPVYLLFAERMVGDIEYRQPLGSGITLDGALSHDLTAMSFIAQAIHQHGQGYIDLLALGDVISPLDLVRLDELATARLSLQADQQRAVRSSRRARGRVID